MRLWMLCQFVLWWGLLGGSIRSLCRLAWGCAPHMASLRWWASAWKSLNVPPTNQSDLEGKLIWPIPRPLKR
nr:MAG TPA: hypothetical protein [Caudoviricetes sp.]